MCNIVVGYKKDLDLGILEAIQYENDDGFGVAWISDKELEIIRSMQFDISKVYKDMPEDRKIFMHFRWATHGEKNIDNCHPFEIRVGKNKYAVMHNGIINIKRNRLDMSDTWHFVNNKIKVWIMQFGMTERTVKLIEKNLGFDRMILLDPQTETYYRFGEWDEEGKVMYSSGLPVFGKQWRGCDWDYDLPITIHHNDSPSVWGGYNSAKDTEDYCGYSYSKDSDGRWRRVIQNYLNQDERDETKEYLNKLKEYENEDIWD